MTDFAKKWEILKQEIAHGTGDGVWLLHHASYLLRIDGTLFLVDPVLDAEELHHAESELISVLHAVRFVLLTHLHSDHFDIETIRALKDIPCLWIMPAFMTENERAQLPIDAAKIRFVQSGETLELGNCTISPFDSMHYDWYKGELYGVPETGYMVTVSGKRILLPGDIRSYNEAPPLPETDILFAHVWLGRQMALDAGDNEESEFAAYFARTHAKIVFLTHLYDMGREKCDLWTEEHAHRIAAKLQKMLPNADIRIPSHGVFEKTERE